MQRPDDASFRGWRFETYEERLALSAQPIADFWIDQEAQHTVEPSSAIVHPLLATQAAEGHGWLEVAAAREHFGLRGSRQTIAIIDSGIAYDHIALGGGLGKAHRVVGGWDFAENDANPYDDGPGGFHGTHVAGIVGANDSRYSGVAPGANLVALRVFDDRGLGQLTWVEQALDWVHEHRNAFDNPITTVNLSLGTEWNSGSLPNWATFEDELKQLADDGILVSVAAGNSFLVYNAPGLSYPAVSQYVTPVASVDASGNLSAFSQRHDRVLAAPGERVMSTVPDHFYGGDGYKNDWGATSGTSMAAPYFAGASALLREAMQNLGITGINQAKLYEHFRSTADTIFDAVTGGTYRRLNLGRALETLVGADDFGSSAAEAKAVGQLGETITVSGTIGRVSDQDFFQFTAGATGKATLTLRSTEQLAAAWRQTGGQGNIAGNTLTLDVVAGQSYVVGVAGGGLAIGKYGFEMRLTPVAGGDDSGAENQGDQGSGKSAARVEIRGGVAEVHGTASDDTIRWQAGPQQSLVINGVSYGLAGVTRLTIHGRGGHDALELVGGAAAETVNLRPGSVELFGPGYRVAADEIESVRAIGGAGDRAWLFDSAGDDMLVAGPTSARLSGAGFDNRADSFNLIVAVATRGGHDTAELTDSAGNDSLLAGPTSARLSGAGYAIEARDFERFEVRATGGYDSAMLRDSLGADRLDASATHAWLRGNDFDIRLGGFDFVSAQATPASGDVVTFVGASLFDRLSAWSGARMLTGNGSLVRASGFGSAEYESDPAALAALASIFDEFGRD